MLDFIKKIFGGTSEIEKKYAELERLHHKLLIDNSKNIKEIIILKNITENNDTFIKTLENEIETIKTLLAEKEITTVKAVKTVKRKKSMLTKKEVLSVFEQDVAGIDNGDIALAIGCSIGTINAILSGNAYARWGYFQKFKGE